MTAVRQLHFCDVPSAGTPGLYAAAADALAACVPAGGPEVAAAVGRHLAGVFAELLDRHVAAEFTLWALARGIAAPARPGTWPDEFLQHMRREGWSDLFARVPPLASIVDQVLALELAALDRMLSHIATDRTDLCAFLGVRDVTPVLLDLGLSDAHDGRRRVARIGFAEGRRLYYKPRPLGFEAALADVARWLDRMGFPHVPRFPRVLDCGDHGWSEAIDERPPADRAGRERFFIRLGALAALIGACGGTDGHRENILMAGDSPVLVDAETLFHPRIAASPDHSIFATEIFPRTLAGPNGQTISYPGFDGLGTEGPRLADHIAQMREGATAMAAFLERHAEVFWSRVVPKLAGAHRSRVVLRPTGMYAAVLAASLGLKALSAPGGRQAVFARLRAYDDPRLDAAAWDRIHACEAAALARGDIPSFLADLHTGHLFTGEGIPLSGAELRPYLTDARTQFGTYLASCRELFGSDRVLAA